MASFLDKTGLTKFWELIKQYLNYNFMDKQTCTYKFDEMDTRIKNMYNDISYLEVPDNLEITYINKTYFLYSDNIVVKILIKFYNKNLILKNIHDLNTPVKVLDLAKSLLQRKGNLRYLGRLPYNEIYGYNTGNPVYSEISFDIYLKKVHDDVVYLALIPVSLSNSYTFNFISGEQMIRYLKGNSKLMGSYNFYKVNLVTDSPYDFTDSIAPSSNNDTINLDRLIHLYNRHDIEYTIRYPRYLNGLLTFLKVDNNNNTIVLADKTPNVVDNTYNEVVLTQNTGLYMYGNIYTRDYPGSLDVDLTFNISSNQDTTDKLLSLSGDISTIYNLFKIYNMTIYLNYYYNLPANNYFQLFHSPYIGSIDIGCFNNFNIPFDPLNHSIILYYRFFNNTGISTAISGIHLLGDHSFIKPSTSSNIKIFSNYTEAYKNCKQLTKLIVYIYLEGDITLDSNLEDTYINQAYYQIIDMVGGSSKLNNVVLLPGVKRGLNTEDFTKFSKLIKPIADKLKLQNTTWNVEIHNSNV